MKQGALFFHRTSSQNDCTAFEQKRYMCISMSCCVIFLLAADCPVGSHSSQNRTCILCPLGTYQPSRGQLTCISCGHNLTTTSNGTVDKMQCISKFVEQKNKKLVLQLSVVIAKPKYRILSIKRRTPNKRRVFRAEFKINAPGVYLRSPRLFEMSILNQDYVS